MLSLAMRELPGERGVGEVGKRLRSHVQSAYVASIQRLREAPAYARLLCGEAPARDYDALIGRVCETHLLSAHFVAFVFSLAPPAAAQSLQHNLLEELGADGGEAHPTLLVRLLEAAGLAELEGAVRKAGRLRLRDRVMEPMFYASLREAGLAALVEVVGFEFMLSRLASEFAQFLRQYRGLSEQALEWFTHHSEVDLEHAEQGLDAVAEYVDYYEFGLGEATDIVDTALEENIYLKRYFGSEAAALGAAAR